jgi:hypothetical protein
VDPEIPDPYVFNLPDPDLDPSLFVLIRIWVRIRILPSTRKKSKKNLDFYHFVTFIFEDWCKCTLISCKPLTKKQDPDPNP